MADIFGTPGDDVLTGTAAADTINGEGGNDQLDGAGGDDVLNGGAGDDTIRTGTGVEIVDGGAGGDYLRIDRSSTTTGVSFTLNGPAGSDGSRTINIEVMEYRAGSGKDIIDAASGVGEIWGGGGDDTLTCFGHHDFLFGEAGNDTIIGGAGFNHLSGGSGDDRIEADGYDGDSVYGDDGNDLIIGGAGSQTVFAGSGNDIVEAGAGDDRISGEGGIDTLNGGDGDDNISAGAKFEAVTVDGGAGLDLLFFPRRGTAVGVSFSVDGTIGSDGSRAINVERLVYYCGPGADSLTGGVGDDQLNGYIGNDTLRGGAGRDVLNGEDGNDVLSGGAGADYLDGGFYGNDTISYYSSWIGVTINLDTGSTSGGEAQGDGLTWIENVNGSQGGDVLSGAADANVLAGFGGNDRLDGDAGDDVLRGGAGADELDGGAGIDTASYYNGSVGVAVNLATGAASGGEAQGDVLTGIETLSGSQGNDSLVGSSGVNALRGWSGDDVLQGGAGADRLVGGAGIDTASYDAGTVGIVVDLSIGTGTGGEAQGDTLVGVENLRGSQGGDHLIGSTGANVLQGWSGTDVLIGGRGADTLTGGDGADRFLYIDAVQSPTGAGADRITDFTRAQGDRIELWSIDADTTAAGNQAFTFIGPGLYTGVAGQLRYSQAGGVTTIAGDVNGDSVSDFHIQLTGIIALMAADLAL